MHLHAGALDAGAAPVRMEKSNGHVLILENGEKDGVKFDYLQKHSDTALEKFALKNKDKTQDVNQILRGLLTSDTMMSLLIEIAHLKVFSNEMHEEFKERLQELGALKQLKYFYSIPMGQLIGALTQLHSDMPTSQWWKSLSVKVNDSIYCSKKTCDFLKDEGKLLHCFVHVVLLYSGFSPSGVCPENPNLIYSANMKGNFIELN